MKIIICGNDREGESIGGPDVWLLRICQFFRHNDYEVVPAIFYYGNKNNCPRIKSLIDLNFNTYKISLNTYHSTESQVAKFLSIVSEVKPHLIIANHVHSCWFSKRYLNKANIPVIGVLHANNSFYQGLIEEFVWKTNKFSLKNVVSVSSYLKEYANRKGNTNIDVISCGTKIPNIETKEPTDKLRIVYIGRFRQWQKRIFDLTEAFCLAANQIKNTEYYFYGNSPGDEEQTMLEIIKKNKCESKVHIKGLVSHDLLPKELSDKHIVVLMSDYEGLPMALIEAMAIGLVPICLKEESGINEVITHEKNGILINDRKESFIKAVNDLKQDILKWRELSDEAHKSVLENYSDEIEDRKWINLVNEIVKNNKPNFYKFRIPQKIKLPKKNDAISGDIRAKSQLIWYKQLRKNVGLRTRLKKLLHII